MPIEFLLTGIMLLVAIFFMKSSINKIYIILSLTSVMVGYFVNWVIYGKLAINIFNIFALILVLILMIYNSKTIKLSKLLLSIIVTTGVYILANLNNIDYSSYFNPWFIILLVVVLSVINNLTFTESCFAGVWCVFSSEIVNYYFLIKQFDIMAMFGAEFVFCIVAILYINIAIRLIKKGVLRLRYEKVY